MLGGAPRPETSRTRRARSSPSVANALAIAADYVERREDGLTVLEKMAYMPMRIHLEPLVQVGRQQDGQGQIQNHSLQVSQCRPNGILLCNFQESTPSA
jgi:hypothetical protein